MSDSGLRIRHSQTLASERAELESFLFDAVYRRERLIPVRKAAADRLETMFNVLVKDPELKQRFRKRAESNEWPVRWGNISPA